MPKSTVLTPPSGNEAHPASASRQARRSGLQKAIIIGQILPKDVYDPNAKARLTAVSNIAPTGVANQKKLADMFLNPDSSIRFLAADMLAKSQLHASVIPYIHQKYFSIIAHQVRFLFWW